MVFLFWAIDIILLFLILYGIWDELYDVVIVGFVFFNAIIVAIAEFLSIFSCYNLIGSNAAWIASALVMIIFFRAQINAGIRKTQNVIRNKKWTFSILKYVCWIAVCIVAVIAIVKALTYPPQNYDSMIYHLPRSFMYWKNESIHNMPFSHRQGLWTGPYNAILMTQLRIYTNGSDYLLNMIQLPSYLVACLACGKMAESFCKSVKTYKSYYEYVSIFLMLTVPIALLQASTTQSDLLLGSFSLITVYLLIKYLDQKENVAWRCLYLIAAGLSGGITLLTKVNGAIVLLAGGIYFVIILLIQREWKKLYTSSLVIGLCAVSMTAGHWIRNAIDLNGDFLAFGISYNLGSTLKEPSVMKLILNIGYLFRSDNKRWSAFVTEICLKICEPFSFATDYPKHFEQYVRGVSINSHDNYPYGFHMVLVVLIIVAAIILSFVKKNKKLLLYSLLCVSTWIITAVSVNAPKFSISRYMLGELFMVFPLAAVECAVLNSWLSKRKCHFLWMVNIGICFCCIGLFIYGMNIQLNDCYMPSSEIRNKNGDHRTYEELRFGSQLRGWEEPCEKFMEIIMDKEYDNIGFQEDVPAGAYMMLYELRESKYQVQYVNAQYGMQHGDVDFIPDCIICVSAPESMENVIAYKGIEYEICTEEYNVVADVANTALYVKQ